MSYDFHILRLRKPAGSLWDLTEDHVVYGDWYGEWRDILRSRFTGFRWDETSSGMRGRATDPGAARLEISLLRDADFTSIIVNGSFHADQIAFIQELAVTVGATAFDIQTGRKVN